MAANEEPRSGARAVHVMNCFEGDDPELSVSELAQLAALPVSTTHRLAQALVRGHLLEQDPSPIAIGSARAWRIWLVPRCPASVSIRPRPTSTHSRPASASR